MMAAIPLKGDRSARDDVNYPSLHSKGIEDGNQTIHLPPGTSVGDIAYWDGTKWTTQPLTGSQGVVPPIMTLGTYEGSIQVATSPLGIYNRYGESREIIEVFLSVSAAPVGADILVDILVGGASIFGATKATLAAGQTTGVITSFLDPVWLANSKLVWDITQVGSSTPGSDLVVHILHEKYSVPGSGGSGS